MRQCPNSFYLPLNDFFLTTSVSTRNVSANQEVQPGLRSTISSPSTCPNDQAPSARATHLCLAFWSLAPRWAVKAGCLYEVFCVNPCVAAQKTSPCQLRCIHFAQVVCRKSIKLSHGVPWTGEVVRDFPRLLQWKTCFKDLVMNQRAMTTGKSSELHHGTKTGMSCSLARAWADWQVCSWL